MAKTKSYTLQQKSMSSNWAKYAEHETRDLTALNEKQKHRFWDDFTKCVQANTYKQILIGLNVGSLLYAFVRHCANASVNTRQNCYRFWASITPNEAHQNQNAFLDILILWLWMIFSWINHLSFFLCLFAWLRLTIQTHIEYIATK